MKNEIVLIELFAGIGGFVMGLENAGFNFYTTTRKII